MPLPSGPTLAELIADKAHVLVHCDICRMHRPADLHAMLKTKGPDYVLWDRIPWCKTDGCLGRVRFQRLLDMRHEWLWSETIARVHESHCHWVTTTMIHQKAGRIEVWRKK